MGKMIQSYQSDDGQIFATELEMLAHEAKIALTEEFPQLKVSIPAIMQHSERISTILEPLAAYYRRNHPETAEPETTLEHTVFGASGKPKWDTCQPVPGVYENIQVPADHGELAGLCDCSAGMNGDTRHSLDCPAYRATVHG